MIHSADFTQLMELTGTDSYDELFGNDGESGCEDFGGTHANSTAGLPNLEAQLLVEHAELITGLEKISVMILSSHAATVSANFSAKM